MHFNHILHVPQISCCEAMSAGFNRKPWESIPAQSLSYFMGEPPVHRPDTRFKMAWDHHVISLIFQVRDRYVRAVARNYQDPVYQDSCVEFFFTPNNDLNTGYFNLEINCCGTGLFEYHPSPDDMIPMPLESFQKISIHSTQPRLIEPEITSPLTWTIEYRIPVDILLPYCPVTVPVKGVHWRGNVYKCADRSTHPHWLTWAPVDFPRPRFHMPEFFGQLMFV